MEIPPTLVAERLLNQQNVALSVIKSSAEADSAIASILDQAVQNVPISGARGGSVNFKA